MIPTQRIRKTAFWVGVALPSVALVAIIWVTHATNGQFNAAFASVTRTYNVLNILEQTQAHIADAETGQRGYLLTGRQDYYSLHDAAMAAIHNNIQDLTILFRGHAAEETNLIELQNLVAARLALAPRTNASQTRPVDAVALTDHGRDTINRLRVVIFRMREQQADLLVQRQRAAETRILSDQTVSLAFAGVAALALIAVVAIVLRMERLRQMVTICAWTGQVQFEGNWISLEDYLERRFGVSVSHGLSNEAATTMVEEMRKARAHPPPPAPAAK